MSKHDDTAPDDPEPGRERRSYPHGSGDRNSWSPFGKDRMPIHEGGNQRQAPPDGGDEASNGEENG